MAKFIAVAALAVLLSACGFTVTSTPKNPNVCSVGTTVGCTNHDSPQPARDVE